MNSANEFFRLRSFTNPPLSYLPPKIIFHRDRHGEVNWHMWALTWPDERHALLFFLHWHTYVWSNDRDTYSLQLSNPEMNKLYGRQQVMRYALDAPRKSLPDFLILYEQLQQEKIIERGLPAQ